jgi:glycosyltransferase involved in cell wall biosynthesis
MRALEAGFDVALATNVGDRSGDLARMPITVFPLNMKRGSLAPWKLLPSLWALRSIIRKWRPGIVNAVALRTAVLTGAALWDRPDVRVVNTIAGLGYVFSSSDRAAFVLRAVTRGLIRVLFSRKNSIVVVQNVDDQQILQGLIGRGSLRVIPGSGVDVDVFKEMPEPAGDYAVAFAGRILRDKGVEDIIGALRILRERGAPVRAIFVGRIDKGNPSALRREALEEWVREGLVEWHGEVRDVREVWKVAHVALLPSYREGLPKSLLEAAACGRALIASDVPGCRAVVRNDQNGIVVPVRDPARLADAIEILRRDPIKRREMGRRARIIVASEFSADHVNTLLVAAFREALGAF